MTVTTKEGKSCTGGKQVKVYAGASLLGFINCGVFFFAHRVDAGPNDYFPAYTLTSAVRHIASSYGY